MSSHYLHAEQLSRLASVDSPSIANVIELFGVRSNMAGYTGAALKAIYPDLPPAVGYAVTATYRAAYPSEAGFAYDDMARMIELGQTLPKPTFAVFQDLDDPPRAVTYGEIMASTFQAFSFSGLITSGAGRDFVQVGALNFPCWASSLVVSHGYPQILEVGVPVCIAGLQVKTGDLLHADGNGVVSIPHRIAAGVAELIEPYLAVERQMLEDLKAPNLSLATHRNSVGQATLKIQDLRKRARGILEAMA